jgi:hypothetical protein
MKYIERVSLFTRLLADSTTVMVAGQSDPNRLPNESNATQDGLSKHSRLVKSTGSIPRAAYPAVGNDWSTLQEHPFEKYVYQLMNTTQSTSIEK